MGMNPAEFWCMSWRDFQLKQRGFFEYENEKYKTHWEQTRFMAYYAASGFLKKGTRMKDLIEFELEKRAVELPTKEDMRYWALKYGRHIDEQGRFYN